MVTINILKYVISKASGREIIKIKRESCKNRTPGTNKKL